MTKTEAKHVVGFAGVIVLVLVIGIIGFAINNYWLSQEISELKANGTIVPTESVVKVVRSENVAQLLRDNYITQCKLKRSLEFYTVKDGKVAPRELLAKDRLDCIDEAFAKDDPDGGTEVIDAAKAASDARIQLFRTSFDMCNNSMPPEISERDRELTCVVVAYNKTLSVSY